MASIWPISCFLNSLSLGPDRLGSDIYKSDIRLTQFDSGLHGSYRPELSLLHAVKLWKHRNFLMQYAELLFMIFSSIYFRNPVFIFHYLGSIYLFINALQWNIVNGYYRIFVFILVALRRVVVFCIQPLWFIVTPVNRACESAWHKSDFHKFWNWTGFALKIAMET